MIRRSIGSAIVVLLALTACGGPQGPSAPNPPGAGSATLAPGTTVLGDAELNALTSVTDTGEYVFADDVAGVANLGVGDVFIAGISSKTPLGALRRVDGVTHQGGQVVVDTSQATLQEAFSDLDVRLETELTPSSTPNSIASQAEGLSFPLDIVASGDDGSVEVHGALALAPTFDLTFDIDITSFQIDELTMEFGADQTLLANLTGSGKASFEKTVTLGTIPFAPIILPLPTPVGPVPLVITPAAVLEAGLGGSISGSFEASVNQEASFTAGVGYENGQPGGFWDGDSDLQFEQPTYGAALGVKAWAGPRLEVKLYGAVGPYASVEGYAQASASVDGPPPCTRGVLNAGLTAKAGIDLLIDDFETTLLDEVVPLASFDSCSTDPNAPRPAVTWARSLGRAGSLGEDATAVTEAADGSFLVVGNSSLFDGITGSGAAVWAMRLDQLGNLMWQKAYSGANVGGAAVAAAQVPGGFVIATRTGLIALDTGGNVRWSKTYATGEYLQIDSLASTPEGGLFVAGVEGNTSKAWAAQLGADGDVIWSRTFTGDDFAGVTTLADGGHALVGSTGTNDGDAYVVRLDAAGAVIWERTIDNRYDLNGGEGDPILQNGTDAGFDIAEQPGGGLVIVGYSYGAFPNPEANPAGHYEAWVANLSADGELVDSTVHRVPSEAENDVAQTVVVTQDGGTVVLGMQADDASDLFTSEDVLVVQGSAYSVLGGAGNDTLNPDSGAHASNAAIATSDGGLIVAATSDTFGSQPEFWVLKLGRTANINFPYKDNPTGSSYQNEDAVSSELGGIAVDVALTPQETAPIDVEATPVIAEWQAP